MKIAAIIQTRMGSTRLPGKVMKQLQGKTVLSHVIERVRQSKLIDEIIIATTVDEKDDVVNDEAIRCGAKVFRGSEEDVLSRYYYAAKTYNIDVIVRITSDCPLIDPNVIDELIACYLNGQYSLVTNAGSDLSHRTYPRGLDTEVFSMEVLEEAFHNARQSYQHEHVTPYIYENKEGIRYYKNDTDFSQYRLTLDTEEDFTLIKEIYDRLYSRSMYLSDIMDLFRQEPHLFSINAHIEQKKIN